MRYLVTGYALVPVQVAMFVESSNPMSALEDAEVRFESDKNRSIYIVPGTEDDRAVYGFQAREAEPEAALAKAEGRVEQ